MAPDGSVSGDLSRPAPGRARAAATPAGGPPGLQAWGPTGSPGPGRDPIISDNHPDGGPIGSPARPATAVGLLIGIRC